MADLPDPCAQALSSYSTILETQQQQQQQQKRLNQRMQIYQVLKSESPGYYCKWEYVYLTINEWGWVS